MCIRDRFGVDTSLEYRALLPWEGGEECWDAVEERCQEEFRTGESGELLIQGGRFLDFAGQYGRAIQPLS